MLFLKDRSGINDTLMFHRAEPVLFLGLFFRGRNHIQVPASPSFGIHQTAKVKVWSYIRAIRRLIRRLRETNTSSERLKANIVDRTTSALPVNLSLSVPQPNQTQVRGSGHDGRRACEPRTRSRPALTHNHLRGHFAVHVPLCE